MLFRSRFLGQPQGVEWEVLEVEIDLSIPGPIKIFNRVSRQYTLRVPSYLAHDYDNDILLDLPLGENPQPSVSLSVRFLRVAKLGKERVAKLGGVDNMHVSWLIVDRDAGYVIIWVAGNLYLGTPRCSYIWWLDEREPGNMGAVSYIANEGVNIKLKSWASAARLMVGGFTLWNTKLDSL